MKVLVTILVVLAIGIGGYKLFDYWDKTSQDQEVTKKAEDGSDIQESDLPGMPYTLEPKYNAAKQKGATGVRDFLEAYGKAPKFEDPRKAWVQLDYAMMIAGSDPVEAKKVFLDVKQRIRTNAPIYRRIRAMSKAFE
jgi:hypothetical protein